MKGKLDYEYACKPNVHAKILWKTITEASYKIKQSFVLKQGGLRVNSRQ